MSSLNPLPDLGPPTGAHDGSTPSDVFSCGTWQIKAGALVNVPPFLPPSGFEVK